MEGMDGTKASEQKKKAKSEKQQTCLLFSLSQCLSLCLPLINKVPVRITTNLNSCLKSETQA